MSVYLQFDKSRMVAAGTADDWDAFAEWTSDCDDYAPDVLEFIENGESDCLPAITEQLALAHSCRPPKSKRLNQHVVAVMKAIEESKAMRVDVLNDDPQPEDDTAEALADLKQQTLTLSKSLLEMNTAIMAMAKVMQDQASHPMPQPSFNFTLAEKGLQLVIPPDAIRITLNITNPPVTVTNDVQPTPIENHTHVEPTPVNVLPAASPVTVENHHTIEMPERKPFAIVPIRDPDTGLATRFEPVGE